MAAAGILYFDVVNLTIPACRRCEFEICTKFGSNNVIVTEIDTLMLKTFI